MGFSGFRVFGIFLKWGFRVFGFSGFLKKKGFPGTLFLLTSVRFLLTIAKLYSWIRRLDLGSDTSISRSFVSDR